MKRNLKPCFKAVIFDVGGVLKLTDTKATKKEIIAQFPITLEQINQSYRQYYPAWQAGEITACNLWRQIILDYVPDHHNFQRVCFPNQKVYRIAAYLKKLGYQTAIMSNVNLEDKQFNEKIGLYKPFKTVILSTDVGIKKPNPEIYLLTIKKLNVKPEETIFIDDTKHFIDIANSLGMKGIVYLNPDQLQKDLEKLLAVSLSDC
ncbi:MAG TPA: HAD-IA family hydrolase [Candidatus Woesebacteria bacterium]|nr:HAD-IA family hydrolase [Candidatus Woesebacteria bacterium]